MKLLGNVAFALLMTALTTALSGAATVTSVAGGVALAKTALTTAP